MMKIVIKIMRYELNDLLRNKWLFIYGSVFLIITDVLFRFSSSTSGVVISLMNIVLIIVPLVSFMFGIIYLYNSREFIELLLTQPVSRNQVYWGMFIGLSVPLSLVFLAGINIPLLYMETDLENLFTFFNLGITGLALTWIFTALAFYFSTKFEDKIKGLGLAVLLWLFFIILYDGIILIVLFLFSDYPLDKFAVFLNLINPVNLGRIFILLQLDISALMGYTGAVFSRFFGSQTGILLAIFTMIIWIIIPLIFGNRKFLQKDF